MDWWQIPLSMAVFFCVWELFIRKRLLFFNTGNSARYVLIIYDREEGRFYIYRDGQKYTRVNIWQVVKILQDLVLEFKPGNSFWEKGKKKNDC